YYRPHTSGLTIYAERLATGLVARGHEVTVLTSRFDPRTSSLEHQRGVRIVRAPVWFRVSRGVVMPTFGWLATRLAREHDVISLHLPQFDAAGVALRGRWMRKPTTLTYHCDLLLPPGLLNRVANGAVDVMNRLAGALSHRVIAYTEDYATSSPFLRRLAHKLAVIPPPVELPELAPSAVEAFRAAFVPDSRRPVIGMAARLATEKGVEVLVNALPRIVREFPGALVLFAGQHEDVLGEADYARRIARALEPHAGRWRFLGVLDPAQMASFFRSIDVVVVPSLNSTESFGLVQVEAMLGGTPSVASALPGVRQPVLQTGMGEVVPIGDAAALGEAIVRVVRDRSRYVRPRAEIENRFSTGRTAEAYEALFEELRDELRRP
ncbi:MAG: glycosyltransferase family 4 protein, partial [Candidatus Binatia bacterium]